MPVFDPPRGMTARLSLRRVSTVDALAASLRTRILDGELGAGERLRELQLAEAYGVARHSLRSALRALAAEGLVVIEPNRGARVASLTADDLAPLCELRTALEVEAARLALERNQHRLPKAVHDAVRLMAAVCEQPDPPWSAVVEAHAAVHHALVAAAGSPRILRAYEALAGEMRLFVTQLKPRWTLERMAAHHARLLADLERDGPEPLRAHLAEGLASLGVPGRC
jgi:DNA-binding GntR family transcriptional regulator